MGKRNRERRTAKQKHRRRSATERERSRPDPGPDRAQILEGLVVALSTTASIPTPWRAAELLEQSRGYAARTRRCRRYRRARGDPSGVGARVVADGSARNRAPQGGCCHRALLRRSHRARVPTVLSADAAPTVARRARRHIGGGWPVRDRAADVALGRCAFRRQSRRTDRRPSSAASAGEYSGDPGSASTAGLAPAAVRGGRRGRREDARSGARFAGEGRGHRVRRRGRGAVGQGAGAHGPILLGEAAADHDHGRASIAAARRVWIDNPYVAAKVALVQAVAHANRCRTIWIKDLGCVVIVGAEIDLDLVDLLATSLLVQASRAMLVAGAGTMFGVSRAQSLSGSPSWSPTPPASASGSRPPVRRSPKNCDATTGCFPCWRRATVRPMKYSPGCFPERSPARWRPTTPSDWARAAQQRTRRCSTSETRSRAKHGSAGRRTTARARGLARNSTRCVNGDR